MTPSLAAFWALLVQDPAGRRALAETLADWRQEQTQARTHHARRRADASGLVSLTRVLAGIAHHQLVSAALLRVITITLAVAALLPAVFAMSFALRAPAEVLLPSPERTTALAFGYLLTISLPAISFRDFLADPGDASPVLGRMLVSGVCACLLSLALGLLWPLAMALVLATPTSVLVGEALRRWSVPGLPSVSLRALSALVVMGLAGWPAGSMPGRSLQVWSALLAVWAVIAVCARRQPAILAE